jgi:hypothetical protein
MTDEKFQSKQNEIISSLGEIKVKVTTQKKEKMKLTKENFNNTCKTFSDIMKVNDPKKAGVMLLLALQMGGVAARKGNRFSTEIDEKKIDQEDILLAIHTGCSKDTTPRAFARNFANEIQYYSSLNNVPGNIIKKIESLFPEEWKSISDENKIFWASDFQGSNESCPEEIRNLINKQYQSQFSASAEKKKK